MTVGAAGVSTGRGHRGEEGLSARRGHGAIAHWTERPRQWIKREDTAPCWGSPQGLCVGWKRYAMVRANSALCVALFVTLCAFNAPVAHSSDATRKAGPQGKDQPRADGGGQATPPPAEHKGVIPPPPIGDEGIYTDAPNPEAGHEKEVIPPPETPSEKLPHPQRLL
jgi:hypothetical protein